MGRPGRHAAAVLGAATFLYWLSLYLYVPLLPGHARTMQATAGWIGIITGSYGIAQLLLRIPVGFASDRWRWRKPFVLIGCACALASALVFAQASSTWGLLLGRSLAGVSATMWVVFTVLYSAYFPASSRTAVSNIVFINTVAILTGQVAGPLVAARTDTATVFWLSAVAGGLAFAIAALVPERTAGAGSVVTLRRLFAVAGNRQLLLIAGLGAVSQYILHGGAFVFVYDWAQRRLGASAADLGALALCSGGAAAIGTLAGGRWLAGRMGARPVVVIGFLLGAVSVAAVPLVDTLAGLYASQVLGGLSRAFTMTLLLSLALAAVPAERGASAVGFFQASYSVGLTGGPLLTGLLADVVGLAGGFWVMAVLALGAAAAGVRLAEADRPRGTRTPSLHKRPPPRVREP